MALWKRIIKHNNFHNVNANFYAIFACICIFAKNDESRELRCKFKSGILKYTRTLKYMYIYVNFIPSA